MLKTRKLMIKISSIFLLLISFTFVGLKAQTVLPLTEAYMNLELVNTVVLSDTALGASFDPMSVLSATDTFLVSVTMIVPDTNQINKFHIKLGTTLGGNDLVDQHFDYDVILNAPQMYMREADMIKICFGEYLNTNVFYSEIKVEDHLGNFSIITNCQSDQ